MKNIICPLDICLHSLHWKKFTGGNLLQSGCMEDVVHTRHGISNGARISDISHIEFDLLGVIRMLCLKFMPEIILFFLITRKDANLSDVSLQEVFKYSITETKEPVPPVIISVAPLNSLIINYPHMPCFLHSRYDSKA